MTLEVRTTYPQFFERNGEALDSGYVYIGAIYQNPITSPIPCFWDLAKTIPAPQPLRTLGGYIVRNGTPASVYVDTDYSITVQNRKKKTIFYNQYIKLTIEGVNVNFTQSLINSVTRTIDNKLSKDLPTLFDFMTNAEILDVQGGYLTKDMQPALQRYSNAITSVRVTGASGITYGSAIPFILPFGKYRLDSGFVPPSYSDIVGHRSMLIANGNFPVIQNVGYSTRIKSIGIVGGTDGISIATGGVDTCTIDLEDVELYNQTATGINTDGASSSTILNIDRLKAYNTQSGAVVIKAITADKVNIRGGWTSVAARLLQVGDALHKCSASLSGMVCTPIGGSTVWVTNYSSVEIHGNNRFGGEAAATILDNYAGIDANDLNMVRVVGNQTYCAGSYAVRFFQIPNIMIWEDNRGLTGTLGFLFDAGITNVHDFRSYLASWRVRGNARQEINFQGFIEGMVRASTMQAETVSGASTLLVADKVAQVRANTATGGGLANVTVTNTTGQFSEPTRTYTGTSAAYNGSINETWNNQLSGLAAGTYTAVFNVEVTSDHQVAGLFYASDLDAQVNLRKGKHVVCIPFWSSSTSANRVGWSFTTLNNSQIVVLGNIRVFAGDVKINTFNNILYGTVPPATLQSELGDITINKNPVVGQPKSWVCTTAGIPGIHTSEGNL